MAIPAVRKFVLEIKKYPLEDSYYQDRLAILKAWADTGAYRKILDRSVGSSDGQLIEVVIIQAFELADEGQTVDPYVIVMDGDRRFSELAMPQVFEKRSGLDSSRRTQGSSSPETSRTDSLSSSRLWDRNYVRDSLIGGFVIYPDGRDAKLVEAGKSIAEYNAKILWDWKEPQTVSRNGYARVQVKFTPR